MTTSSAVRPDLDRLDEIARDAEPAETDERVLELVERAAALPGGLEALVERYAAAPNAIVPRAVSFVFAQRAAAPSAETWDLTRELVGRLRGNDDPSTLINCLTAVQRHLIFGDPLAPYLPPAPELAEFILHCLEQSPLVQSAAIGVLSRLGEDGLLTRAFPPPQAALLRRNLTAMGAASDSVRREELERLLASVNGR